MRFLIDLLKIRHPQIVKSALEAWKADGGKVTIHSERCFELEGRQWLPIDINRFLVAVSKRGHVFLFDLQTGKESCFQNNPQQVRKTEKVRDDDLDSETLRLIGEFRSLEESPVFPDEE